MENVEISFRGSEDEGTLYAHIHNPTVLPGGLHHQLSRYGLTRPGNASPWISGKVKGTRKAVTELIHTYGLTMQVVPFKEHS